ncbi:MAG: GNAT family N-acetyltransferase [Clostridiales bacterium]|nr:GNAT family N-acetyltransferase [Clostridiales bacterium]
MKTSLSKEHKIYDLGNGYSIEHVNWQEFSVYFAVYRIFEDNMRFRQDFDKFCNILNSYEICYFIKKDNRRIGGVLLEPNYISGLILEPPHNEYDTILSKLIKLLRTWSDPATPIVAGVIKPNKIHYYHRQGFRGVESRRCMIRPTEQFEMDWPNDIAIIQPDESHQSEILDLFAEAFNENAEEIVQEKKMLDYYFEHETKDNDVNRASSLLYDKKTNELIGACLISLWEDWPNVFDVAVKPAHQNKGLGTLMLKRALSELKGHYPVLRLFVTIGNDAEMVYHKMGFLSGTETTKMVLKV